jgi:hypothetical protein
MKYEPLGDFSISQLILLVDILSPDLDSLFEFWEKLQRRKSKSVNTRIPFSLRRLGLLDYTIRSVKLLLRYYLSKPWVFKEIEERTNRYVLSFRSYFYIY